MGYVWYFAYGSNLNPEIFRGRRGIEYRRALPAALPGWRLVFDKPPLFPIGESFASVVEDPGARALGVIYEITAEDLGHVELTEGVPIGNYRRVETVVAPLADEADLGTAVPAATLASDRRDPGLSPSVRYMELVISGALLHGLPAEHVASLRQVAARPSSAEADELHQRLHALMRKPGTS